MFELLCIEVALLKGVVLQMLFQEATVLEVVVLREVFPEEGGTHKGWFSRQEFLRGNLKLKQRLI
jgi:hypothetical protein